MKKKNLRSAQWFNNPKDPEMTALYLERYLNYGLIPQMTLVAKKLKNLVKIWDLAMTF